MSKNNVKTALFNMKWKELLEIRINLQNKFFIFECYTIINYYFNEFLTKF